MRSDPDSQTSRLSVSERPVTELLRSWSEGDEAAGEELFPMVYGELRRISEVQIRKSSTPVTMQATEILHEAYLRLANQHERDWRSRSQFFALAATVVRRVLLDHARHRLALRRDRRSEVDLEPHHEAYLMTEARADELVQIHEALDLLATLDARRARVVELRYFGGLSVEETAEVLGVSAPTVKRDWAVARAWLRTRVPKPNGEMESALPGMDPGRPAG